MTATQEWNTQKSEYSKLALYNEVKTELGYESYLSNINVKKFRAALCRLRCSCHGLMIEIDRYENIANYAIEKETSYRRRISLYSQV